MAFCLLFEKCILQPGNLLETLFNTTLNYYKSSMNADLPNHLWGFQYTSNFVCLFKRKCQIKYSATGSTGWYGVAIMVEDFTSRLSSTPLSSIPIQFLVQVFKSSANCSSKPEFSRETRVDGSCIGVPHGSTFNEPIIAKSHGQGNRYQ